MLVIFVTAHDSLGQGRDRPRWWIIASGAEAAGVKATAGKVLGVLDIVGGIVVMVMFFSNR
jgi:hypothetical protein